MEKDKYTVKTSVPETIFIALITIIVFVGAVFLTLLPYTGEHISGSSEKKIENKQKADKDVPDKIEKVTVEGDSMLYTYYSGDKLDITRDISDIKNGDIVVFKWDENGTKKDLIKRVIATEGQVVNIDFANWIVTVDGTPVAVNESGAPKIEPYVNIEPGQPMKGDPRTLAQPVVTYPYTVPANSCFVMGDNRNNSTDSRFFGAVGLDVVWGKVVDPTEK